MKFVMNRNHTITGGGHAIGFVKGQPVHVPKELHREAIAAGATPSDEEEVDFTEGESKGATAPTDADERSELLKMAMKDLRNSTERDLFTANGTPKVKTLSGILGYDVTSAEVAAAWGELNQAEAE